MHTTCCPFGVKVQRAGMHFDSARAKNLFDPKVNETHLQFKSVYVEKLI